MLTPIKDKDFAKVYNAYTRLKEAKLLAHNIQKPIFHGEWGAANNQAIDLEHKLQSSIDVLAEFINMLKKEGYWKDEISKTTLKK